MIADQDMKAQERMKLRGLQGSRTQRFAIQLPGLLLFVAFTAAASVFLFREIASDRLHFSSGGRPIYFISDSAEGIVFGTELRCQGLMVGRVRSVEVSDTGHGEKPDSPRPLKFRVEAFLDAPYSRWIFKENPLVALGVGPNYLGLTTIELEFSSAFPAGEERPPQQLALRPGGGDGGVQAIKDDATLLLESLVRRADLLEERVVSNQASSLERTLWNLDKMTARAATAVTNIESSALELVGKTSSERRALRAELLETIEDVQKLSKSLDELVSRVGDTGLGRMLIKRKTRDTPDAARGR